MLKLIHKRGVLFNQSAAKDEEFADLLLKRASRGSKPGFNGLAKVG